MSYISPRTNYYAVIPKRNCAAYFPAALKSLKVQDICFKQIIVSENYSTDGSADIALSQNGKNGVKVVRPPSPLSAGQNVAYAVRNLEASDGYTMIGSADDIWASNFLRLHDSFLRMQKRLPCCVWTDRIVMNEHGLPLYVSGSFRHPVRGSGLSGFSYYAGGCRFIISSALFQTAMLKDIADLIEAAGDSYDWVIIMEAARRGEIIYLPLAPFWYRVHSASTSSTRINDHRNGLHAYEQWLRERGHQAEANLIHNRLLGSLPMLRGDAPQSAVRNWPLLRRLHGWFVRLGGLYLLRHRFGL